MAQPDPPVRDATVVLVKLVGKRTKRTSNVIADAIYASGGGLPVDTSFNNVDVLPISVAAGVTRPDEQHASVVSLVYDDAAFTKRAFMTELRTRFNEGDILDVRVVDM